jgi:hypothetical protein
MSGRKRGSHSNHSLFAEKRARNATLLSPRFAAQHSHRERKSNDEFVKQKPEKSALTGHILETGDVLGPVKSLQRSSP